MDVPRRIVEINYEANPGVVAELSMPHEVADASILQGLAPGDRVRGTLRVDRRGNVITALQTVRCCHRRCGGLPYATRRGAWRGHAAYGGPECAGVTG